MERDRERLVADYLDSADLGASGRVPPERELAAHIGLSRAELRKDLAALEAQGIIRRHVGRGTFLIRPVRAEAPTVGESEPRGGRQEVPSPAELATARLALEPRLAALAAVQAARIDLAAIREAEAAVVAAADPAALLLADRRFHRAVAAASRNRALMHLWEELVRLVDDSRPAAASSAADVPSNPETAAAGEHRRLADAIARADRAGAAEAARLHILREEAELLGPPF